MAQDGCAPDTPDRDPFVRAGFVTGRVLCVCGGMSVGVAG
jgi:hypothetical protein